MRILLVTEPSRYFLTTAIDYPNSRPHIGTAFEKIGADVQARYRRMEGLRGLLPDGQRREHRQGRQAAPPSWAASRRHTATTWPGSSRKSGAPWTSASTTSSRPASRAITRAAGSSSRRCTTTATSTRAITKAGTARAARSFKTEKELDENGLLSDPQDAGRAPQRAVPFLRPVEVPGPAAPLLRGEPRLHPAGEPPQ